MRQHKKRNLEVPMIVLGVGLSGVPLLPAACMLGTWLAGSPNDEVLLAGNAGFFISLGWLGVCATIAFVMLLTKWSEE